MLKTQMEKVICPFCGKEVSKKHEALCGKNPNRRGIKKGQKHKSKDDKTAGKASQAVDVVEPTAPAESHSNIIQEINMNQEFDKMAEKFKGSSNEDKEKKYKYKCECGEYFNLPAEGNKCPFCGQ